jgi:hypothetical protein
MAETHEYLFDVKMFASIRVKAADEATAQAMLRAEVYSATANLGSWPNGDPIIAEVSVDDDNPDIIEIDGEPQ